MSYRAPRGTHDIWGDQAARLSHLETVCRGVFERYGFTELRTPTFEDAGLFIRSIGESTDIVEKEMYVFEDRKGRKLALRPEGTASVVRAYLEGQFAQALPVGKIFYSGPMFRYERPQAGRYREFFQIGAEYFGNTDPSADAEIIVLARDILRAAALSGVRIHLNTLGCAECRPAFREALTKYFSSASDLCSDCVRRLATNPLRILDCKIDGARFTELPRMEQFLCAECLAHFCRVRELLEAAGCDYQIDHRLVRGIDYYTRTIFEVRSSALGSQDALAAGGRYDNLVAELGGKPTPAVGFALGSERVMLAAQGSGAAWQVGAPARVLVAVSGVALEKEAFAFASRLRASTPGDPVRRSVLPGEERLSVEGPFADRTLKSQLRLADRLGARFAVIFGEEEFARGMVAVRDLANQSQRELPLSEIR